MDKHHDLTPEELAKGRTLYARLADGYDFARPTSARTPEEQSILDAVARTQGQAFAARFAELILMQARAVGDL